jgi:hypothetical protein
MNGFTQAGLLVYFFFFINSALLLPTHLVRQAGGAKLTPALRQKHRYCILTAADRKVVYFVFRFTARNILHACEGSVPAHTWHFSPLALTLSTENQKNLCIYRSKTVDSDSVTLCS